MNRRPGILWIFLRVLLTAIGVFVAAAVISAIARLLSRVTSRKGEEQVGPEAAEQVGEAAVEIVTPVSLSGEDLVELPCPEVEDLKR